MKKHLYSFLLLLLFLSTNTAYSALSKTASIHALPGDEASAAAFLPTVPGVDTTIFINFCPGASQAQIICGMGFVAYQWYAPGPGNVPVAISSASGGTSPTLTINSPVVGTTYTLEVTMLGGTIITKVRTLQYATISLNAIATTSSCIGGASGGASVQAIGSITGYNYAWYGPSSPAVISTSFCIANMPAGVYTVQVSDSSAAACGSTVSVIPIGISPANSYTVIRPFCGNTAYLNTPTLSSTFQWYNGNSAIASNQGGTANGYTVTGAVTGALYHVTYISSQGCQDSLTQYLYQVSPGTLSVVYSQSPCQGISNGIAIASLSTAPNAAFSPGTLSAYTLPGLNSFSTVPYAAGASNFTLNNLAAGGYSLNAFDGTCAYSTTFAVASFSFNFNVSPLSATVCPGSSILASASFSSPITPAQYSYSWAPTTFLAGNVGNQISAFISPTTVPLGTSSTIIYTVVVTPSLVNCPVSKTLAVTSINLTAPTISVVPVFCQNGPAYTIVVNPPGGTFINGPGGPAINPQTGILTPSLASAGINSFSYSLLPGTCADVGSTFSINAIPALTVSGNTAICQGESTTLTVSGANTYTWLNNPPGSQISITPAASSIYSVSGSLTSTGCSATKTLAVIVNNNPTLTVTGNTVICAGQSAVLNVSGANSYFWNNGLSTAQVTLTPASTLNYSVTGSYSATGCPTVKTITILVNTNPTITVSGNTTICSGQSTTLNLSGASTYSWSVNGSAASQVTLTPASTTSYSITGTNANTGCSTLKTILVTVNNNPTLTLTANTTICQGQSITLMAGGGQYYFWNNSSTPASSVYPITPTVTSTYSLLGTAVNGCTATRTVAVVVTPCTGLEESAWSGIKARLYPNPGSSFVTLETEQACTVLLFDALGQIVFEKKFSTTKNTIDISTFPNGMYVVKVIDLKKETVLRLIKTDQ